MESLRIYSAEDVKPLLRKRDQEKKVGEQVQFCSADWANELAASPASFVLLGIPEDVGVRANFGRPGASTAFKPALDSFLNQQSNAYLSGNDIVLLGEIETADLMNEARLMDPRQDGELKALRQLVAMLDKRVSSVIKVIVSAGKIPLIVGGGHNNAYGNIKGSSEALAQKIGVINCDPHLDFRPLEGRHSGNGFSYAFEEGLIEKYSVFSMHEQYNSQRSIAAFNEKPAALFFQSFERIFVRGELDYRNGLQQCLSFVSALPCGVELDMDAITNAPSSAKTSSGLTALQARQFAFHCGLQLDAKYFHVAEAAPVLSHIKADNKTGKLIAYLLTDFIKGRLERLEQKSRTSIGFNLRETTLKA